MECINIDITIECELFEIISERAKTKGITIDQEIEELLDQVVKWGETRPEKPTIVMHFKEQATYFGVRRETKSHAAILGLRRDWGESAIAPYRLASALQNASRTIQDVHYLGDWALVRFVDFRGAQIETLKTGHEPNCYPVLTEGSPRFPGE